MPRKAKGIHTSPENAGEQNLPDNYAETHHDDEDLMQGIMPIRKHGRHMLETYKGLWTDEDLERELDEYFQYCFDNEVKPCKAGIRVWLGISSSQQYDWANKPEKYGRKSEIMRNANDTIEMSYIGRVEKYPTGNIFLLKTSHGHIESSKLDVVSNGNTITNGEEVKDMVSKLGLDK